MGKNAQEMPLVQQTFTGVSLGNAEHLTLSTIPIRSSFVNLSGATISDCSSGKMTVDSSCPMPFKKTQKDAFISCICSNFIAKALGQMFEVNFIFHYNRHKKHNDKITADTVSQCFKSPCRSFLWKCQTCFLPCSELRMYYRRAGAKLC